MRSFWGNMIADLALPALFVVGFVVVTLSVTVDQGILGNSMPSQANAPHSTLPLSTAQSPSPSDKPLLENNSVTSGFTKERFSGISSAPHPAVPLAVQKSEYGSGNSVLGEPKAEPSEDNGGNTVETVGTWGGERKLNNPTEAPEGNVKLNHPANQVATTELTGVKTSKSLRSADKTVKNSGESSSSLYLPDMPIPGERQACGKTAAQNQEEGDLYAQNFNEITTHLKAANQRQASPGKSQVEERTKRFIEAKQNRAQANASCTP